jgi:excisionase family DNA binding protein
MPPSLYSVSDAASRLSVSAARVRALIDAAELDAEKIGGRWLLDAGSVERRLGHGGGRGRPFEPHNAWSVIFLASGLQPDWISSSSQAWRLRQQLAAHGVDGLGRRLRRRANVGYYRCHPGELAYLRNEKGLVLSGASAASASGLDLVAGQELDAYVREKRAWSLISDHALSEVPRAQANVTLRMVPDRAWHLADADAAPIAAVALDLAEDSDPRSRRAGERLLDQLSAQSGGGE